MTAKNDRGKRLLQRPAALEGLICLAAAALFVGIYGVQLLNPAYTDWLLTGGDSTQHYLGSAAFRQSRWFFPLGMMDTLHYPQTSSVIFTDSIPLLAVFFKAIRFLFPPQWQYMGLWGLSCLVLQALLAARILREYTSSGWTVFAGSMLLALSPVMIHRLYGHETLAAHWLLLCALQLLLRYRSRYHHPRNAIRLAAFLGFVTPGIHMYFLPMCGFIVAGYALYDALMTRRVRIALAVLLVYGLAAALQIFLLGGYGQGDVTGGGFGLFGFDLNGFINSAGTSALIPSLPFYSGEGYAYLGLGILLLLPLAVLRILLLRRRGSARPDGRLGLSLALIAALSFLASLSHYVRLNGEIIYLLRLPEPLLDLWSIFRATGRLIWPCYYVLLLFALLGIAAGDRSRRSALLLTLCLLLQLYEMSPLYSGRNQDNRQFVSPLRTEAWDQVIDRAEIRHLVLIGEADEERLMTAEYALGEVAVRKNLTMNRFWMVHGLYDDGGLPDSLPGAESERAGNLYVFLNEADVPPSAELHLYRLDDFILGVSRDADDLDAEPFLPPAQQTGGRMIPASVFSADRSAWMRFSASFS